MAFILKKNIVFLENFFYNDLQNMNLMKVLRKKKKKINCFYTVYCLYYLLFYEQNIWIKRNLHMLERKWQIEKIENENWNEMNEKFGYTPNTVWCELEINKNWGIKKKKIIKMKNRIICKKKKCIYKKIFIYWEFNC